MPHFLKKTIVPLFALVFVVATFFLDEKIASSLKPSVREIEIFEKGPDSSFYKEGDTYRLDAGEESQMILLLFENAVLRFAPKTKASLKIENPFVAFDLEAGRLWMNTLNSTISMQISMPNVKVFAEPGIFDIEYAADSVQFISHRRSLTLEVLGNRLTIPERRQLTLSQEKLRTSAETIGKLRYAKLLKEFSYGSLQEPDEWTLDQLRKDAQFLEEYSKEILDKVREAGNKISEDETSFFFKSSEFFKKIRINLTFDQAKKNKLATDHLFEYFDAAFYQMLLGKEDFARRWLDTFQQLAQEVREDPLGRAIFDAEVSRRLNRFAFISPDHILFPAKTTLREFAFASAFALLHAGLNDILDMSASGNGEQAQEKIISMIRRYGRLVEANITKIPGEDAAGIFFEIVRLNDFLDREPKFMREDFLKIAELFEKVHLERMVSREQADDERQFFIAEKLKRIKVIKNFMEKGDIPFQDGRRAVLLLFSHIDALKPTQDQTAVLSYFENQLKELSSFIAFLRSSNAEQLRGVANLQAHFVEFQSSLDELKKIQELLGEAKGGVQISSFRREELALVVSADLSGLGANEVKIVLPEAEDDPRVRIMSARIEEKIFTALYDTARKVFSEIAIEGEKIPNAIRLDNFKKFFLIKIGKLVLPTGITPESFTEAQGVSAATSVLEKVAKSKLLEELKKLNISVEEKYLGFENFKDGIIHIRLGLLGEGTNAKVFAFDVEQKAATVRNLRVQTVLGEIRVNDTFTIRELPLKVEQIYQRAVFEKQREEELEKVTKEQDKKAS